MIEITFNACACNWITGTSWAMTTIIWITSCKWIVPMQWENRFDWQALLEILTNVCADWLVVIHMALFLLCTLMIRTWINAMWTDASFLMWTISIVPTTDFCKNYTIDFNWKYPHQVELQQTTGRYSKDSEASELKITLLFVCVIFFLLFGLFVDFIIFYFNSSN